MQQPKKKSPPHIPHRPTSNCSCKNCRRWLAAAHRMRERARAVAAKRRELEQLHLKIDPLLGGLVLLLLVFTLGACATFKARQACRPQCEDKRGPVLTWYGGPTVPPDAWDECMSACEGADAAEGSK